MTPRWPRSLAARLLGLSALGTALALVFAAIAIGHVLERFVLRGLDAQLDTQVAAATAGVRSDGGVDVDRIASLPAVADGEPGWGWQIDAPGWRGGRGTTIDLAALPPARFPPPPPDGPPVGGIRARPGEALARNGERVHFRQSIIQTAGGRVVVTASAPRRIARAPLREAMVPLLGSLAVLGGGLAVAAIVQLRLGLRPLRRLAEAVAAVRAGHKRHVPEALPDELAPLARELNALIDQNEAGLDHARRHVANLAHGLKTPLAALSLRLAQEGRDPDGSLGALVARIDRHVRHHLGRARAAGASGTRTRTAIAPVVADLRRVLERIHADRNIAARETIPEGLAAAIEVQDLEEIVGNLLDNAWRHARTSVTVTAQPLEAMTEIAIEDDGAGIAPEELGQALEPGRRLDERGDGHGFGLSIAQELAELNGGTLQLDRAPVSGGLRARLRLPRPIG